MKPFLVIVLLSLTTSCAYFQTERVSSDEVLEAELETFNWTDIDTYPSFPSCDSAMEKSEQQHCFENVVFQSLGNELSNAPWVTSIQLQDTVYLDLLVDHSGNIQLEPLSLDSLVRANLPKLDSLIHVGIYKLPQPAPAYKRGIPVRAKFRLPLVVNSEEL